MTHIVLDEQQAQAVTATKGALEVRDPSGKRVGYVVHELGPEHHGFTAEDITIAKERAKSKGPWYTTDQVVERLKSLKRP